MDWQKTHNKCECGDWLWIRYTYRAMYFKCEACGYEKEVIWTCGGVR